MAESASQTPIHPPLPKGADALRLLILQPKVKKPKGGPKNENGDRDEVCAELVCKTFASKPVYECLSYTWGDQAADKRITINGQQFKVRKNLFNALRRLRQEKPRTLWVDAICINQADVEERNAQVSLMAFIYGRATRVLVWLGQSPQPYTSLDREVMYIQSQANGKAIITNPYWSRLWIIQEIVLAQEVRFIHGNFEFEWDEVNQLLAHSLHWNTLEERIRPLIEHRDRRDTDEYRLESLLDKFRGAQCSEKKDKIFGFVGMAHDSEDEIEVDYSVGLFDLYQKLVDFHQASEPLQAENVFMDDLLPEFDRTIRLVKFSALIQNMFEGGVEAATRTVDFNSQPKKYYYARGALAGEILYLGPTYSETISTFKANKTWKKNIEKIYASKKGDAISELRREDLIYSKELLTWAETKLSTIRNIDSTTSFGFRYSAEDDDTLPEETKPEDTETEQNPSAPEEQEPRRFLATNSRIGFAPSSARVGDLVYNFWDCDVAVVLRKLGDDEFSDRWQIVGKADLSSSELKEEGNAQKIVTEALNCAPAEFSWLEEALRDPYFVQMMNLKMDIEVLQKLTC